MRQFKLINATGAEFDMMRRDAWLYDPDGFGTGLDISLSQVGDSYIVTDVRPKMPAPSGTMIFKDYPQYYEFLSFIRSYPLLLAYKPLDRWLYLPVYVSTNLSEIGEDAKVLKCPLDFSPIGEWYESVTEYKANVNEDGGKWYKDQGGGVYGYTYPYTYTQGQNGTIAITGITVPSYCRLHILGPAVNPAWSLYQNDALVASGKCNVTVASGNKLVIDSDPPNMELALYSLTNTFLANEYQDSDFSTERFLRFPVGDSRLYFLHDGPGLVDAYVEVKKRV